MPPLGRTGLMAWLAQRSSLSVGSLRDGECGECGDWLVKSSVASKLESLVASLFAAQCHTRVFCGGGRHSAAAVTRHWETRAYVLHRPEFHSTVTGERCELVPRLCTRQLLDSRIEARSCLSSVTLSRKTNPNASCPDSRVHDDIGC